MINKNESNLDRLCFEYGTQMHVVGNEKNENGERERERELLSFCCSGE